MRCVDPGRAGPLVGVGAPGPATTLVRRKKMRMDMTDKDLTALIQDLSTRCHAKARAMAIAAWATTASAAAKARAGDRVVGAYVNAGVAAARVEAGGRLPRGVREVLDRHLAGLATHVRMVRATRSGDRNDEYPKPTNRGRREELYRRWVSRLGE